MTALPPRPKPKPRQARPQEPPPPPVIPETGPSHRVLWMVLAIVAFAIHLPALTQYGWFRDEFYYLVCARRLAWGFVDHPPLSVALLWAIRAVAGESLLAMRIAAALITALSVFLTARLTAQLGGRRYAQTLAGLGVMLAPIFLAVGRFYSMNALDLLLWTMAFGALADVIREGSRTRWLWLGVVVGLGLLNKISMLWFGLGLAIGLLSTRYGRKLITPWTFVAGALAGAIFLPHLVWQAAHGWPTIEFMRNATGAKMVAVSPVQFLVGQLRAMGWANVILYLPGLCYALFARSVRPWRILAILFLAVAALLLGAGTSRANYLAVAYPPLIALGGLAWESWTGGRIRWVREALLGMIVVLGLPWIPFALPILPVDTYLRYQSAMGVRPSTEERKRLGPLPQHFADMYGWPELAEAVAKAVARLTPEERAGAVVFGQNYGEAAAIDVLGPKLGGLPPAISGHNNYYLWGRGSWDGKVMIIIGGDYEDNVQFFDSVERVGVWDHPYAMPYERGLDISIARGFKGSPAEVWPKLKHFD